MACARDVPRNVLRPQPLAGRSAIKRETAAAEHEMPAGLRSRFVTVLIQNRPTDPSAPFDAFWERMENFVEHHLVCRKSNMIWRKVSGDITLSAIRKCGECAFRNYHDVNVLASVYDRRRVNSLRMFLASTRNALYRRRARETVCRRALTVAPSS